MCIRDSYNILLCKTIIETGIDVPNANTMVMHRADKFGLAQLHQLRGRIGRSHHQAYAYLLVNDTQTLSKQAQRRLEAIRQMEELGSGFFLAMHDLEIRGAGEVLGEEQSGEMVEIGFQIYSDMLKEAVRAMKKGEEPDYDAPFTTTTEINLHTPALLPGDYCPGVNERLSLYKRFANCETQEQVNDLQEELLSLIHIFRVVAAYPGPVVTRYEIEPDTGVKGSTIVNLARDLARSLSLVSIRVIETIPGKNYMALELPNSKRQIVRLTEILSSKVYSDASSRLTIALGKDIAGNPVVADLARMPHLLIAGTTGSGKSVGLNATILSLLYNACLLYTSRCV